MIRPDLDTEAPVAAESGNILHRLVERIERTSALDRPAEVGQRAVSGVVPHGVVKDALSGTWLGHPLHPVMTHVPIGSWLSASLLDLLGGRRSRRGATELVALGILAAVPTAASGSSDWADTTGAERRVGLVHAAGNSLALALQVASLLARVRGRRGRGTVLTLLANAVVGVTGYLGGHLAYNQGVGVDTTAFDVGPGDWTAVADLDDVPEGRPYAAPAGEVTLVLVREGDQVRALDRRCNHRGGPLDEGDLTEGCVVCPWHQSTFRLEDGSVVTGPAVRPQPAYETRVVHGRIEVRRFEPRSLRVNAV